jgi:hypothetical protein
MHGPPGRGAALAWLVAVMAPVLCVQCAVVAGVLFDLHRVVACRSMRGRKRRPAKKKDAGDGTMDRVGKRPGRAALQGHDDDRHHPILLYIHPSCCVQRGYVRGDLMHSAGNPPHASLPILGTVPMEKRRYVGVNAAVPSSSMDIFQNKKSSMHLDCPVRL